MPYCVNCGVELSDHEKNCPLCHTPVINPNPDKSINAKKPYPTAKIISAQKVSKKSIIELISCFFAIPLLICVACNMTINGKITWAGYVIGAEILTFVVFVMPFIITSFTKKIAPVISILFDFLCLTCFLLYIEKNSGGTWFSGFVLPLLMLLFLFILVLTIIYIIKKPSALAVASSVLLFYGAFCVAIEIMVNINFHIRNYLIWSFYPLITLILLAIILIIIDHNDVLKEKLEKKFFI